MSKKNPNSGLGQPEFRYLAVGRIVRSHGIRGEVSMHVLTDFPERFETTKYLYLGNEYEAEPYHLNGYRWHKDNILLTFEEITDRTQADTLKGMLVQIPIAEATPLPEGSYYLYQLIDLEVFTTENQRLGVITSVLETGANDVYVVKGATREILLPNIPDVIKVVDLTAQRMVIQMMPGLI